jgi:hypothetical protein
MKPAINQLHKLSEAFGADDIKLLAKHLNANAPVVFAHQHGYSQDTAQLEYLAGGL